ncbi:MAG: tyrosine--tRNA ligase [Planctomycetes bacterium]|nr:tyrosine--tRNA ligase [Planctomycetota bacterium]
MTKSVEEQLQILARGAEAIFTEEELKKKLEKSKSSGKPLRIKLGLDPTAPDIHLGHTVVLRKLRQFQDLGHQAVLIIGDATARIGDPTGKTATRPILSDTEIEANLKTYLAQVDGILDVKNLEIVHNNSFFSQMRFDDVMRLAGKMTVARMLERDDFSKRYKNGAPISLHEFFYPLMQGWDSVMVKSDVELGGTDQTFNNLVGRDLQRDDGQEPQVVLVMPILPGLDGVQKMSKSLDNYIGVSDTPREMFGKVMSIPDNLMRDYFILLTDLPGEKFTGIIKEDPRAAKGMLGREIVSIYHSPEEAQAADEEFTRIFAEKQLPDEMPEIKIPASELENGEIWICKLMTLCKHAPSTSEARRLVQAGAVTLDGEKISDPKGQVVPKSGQILKSGKRRFAVLKV